MNQKEIKELIELLVEKDITEFELERGDMKVHVKRGGSAAPVVQVAPIAAVQPLVIPPAAPLSLPLHRRARPRLQHHPLAPLRH